MEKIYSDIGLHVIIDYLRTLPVTPGVYRMFGRFNKVLYVGKAKNLKKRVITYTKIDRLSLRLRRMVSETIGMEVITTHTEAEALLLEANMIKKLSPKYNILLRDDRSFPYVLITDDEMYPQVIKHHGTRKLSGKYFGPFASSGSVNQTFSQIQRVFLLRSCTNNVFFTRSRPCLLYQINRCSAPCVKNITQDAYSLLVKQTLMFLSGQNQIIQHELIKQMEKASFSMNYEEAAIYRDRIYALSSIQANQNINLVDDINETDVIAIYQFGSYACIQIFFFRNGCNFGNCSFFPSQTHDQTAEVVLIAFISQFYDNRIPPHEILLSHSLTKSNHILLTEALALKVNYKVIICTAKRGSRRKIIDHAYNNARDALRRRMSTQPPLAELVRLFDLDELPKRIEVYDNSHINGSYAVGGMIVVGSDGNFLKNEYRKFNIKTLSQGDDLIMMREVFMRRFRNYNNRPDLVLIDGGYGQLKVVTETMNELGITMKVIGISKESNRTEYFHLFNSKPFTLSSTDPVLYFLQRLRDEAHRFVVGIHRVRRSKAIKKSAIDCITGIGTHRKRALLHHFGSVRGVSEAGIKDLQVVNGIGIDIAKKIYNYFHHKY
ncbi:MAG: excinuclease ABC subunit UvrC [Rhodospirillaceae bacterium]|jgi:excinuclease ABC subunit C|nr:excinuclease ABC subunit UvrC [Rhodospirillaceae bacterium]